MKKIVFSSIMTVNLMIAPSCVDAGVWQTTKVYANKAMFWKKKHLTDIDFKHVYPKAIYKKSYFGVTVTVTAVIAAGTFTYFTAGAGAPSAATGVSTVASWVGGGGAGSYMAGLSTIGGWFGGNAMVGAAILNGISIGVIGGGTATFAELPLIAKAGVMASVTSSGLDGVTLIANPETKELEYKIEIKIPKDLGSKSTRDLVDKIYDTKEEIQDALEENDRLKQEKLLELLDEYNKKAIKLLKQKLNMQDNQEDLLVLGIIAWNGGEYYLFQQALQNIKKSELNNIGFLNYLYAINSLSAGEVEKTLIYLDNAIDENPYAIEPIILYINALGNNNFFKNKELIEELVKKAEEDFDSDKYETDYSLTGVYFRTATFYFLNKRFVKAEQYYIKALDSLGIMQKYFFAEQLKHIIELHIANSLYAQGKEKKADKLYKSILEDIDEDNKQELESIKNQYLGGQI